MQESGTISVYSTNAALEKVFLCNPLLDNVLDFTISNKNRFFFTRFNINGKHELLELDTLNCLLIKKFTFPDSIKVTSICEYNGKLLIIDVLSHIIELNPDNPSSFSILFQLPPKYIGYDFNIANLTNCDADEMILCPRFSPEIFKLDMNTQVVSQICTQNPIGVISIASPHPYLSCLDLDRNNSTISLPKDFRTSLCQSGTVGICDADVAIKTRPGSADSLHIWLDKGLQDIGNESITLLGALPTGVTMKKSGNDFWFYFPKDFPETSIENLIKQLRYTNSKPSPSLGEREIKMYLYTAKIVSDPAVAHIVISKSKTTNQNITTCIGNTLNINGLNIKKDTTFCLNLKGKEGCDSTHCLSVKFSKQAKGNENKQFCFGSNYIYKGVTIRCFTKKRKLENSNDMQRLNI
jgi:hypothetical protein